MTTRFPATGIYTIGFVAPGKYEVAYTCDLDAVDVVFTPAAGSVVTVAAGQVAVVDFLQPAP